MSRYEMANKLLHDSSNPSYDFEEWKSIIKRGGIGVQSGNPSQRWVYIKKYDKFVEQIEYETREDTIVGLDYRFYSNLNTRDRVLKIIKYPIAKNKIGGKIIG